MALFDRIKAALSSKAPAIADLQRALNEARQLHDDALKDRAWLEGQRREMLLATDAERAKHKSDLVDASDRAADLAIYVEELSKRLVEAEAAADQNRRREAYEAAKAKAAAAVKVVQKDYHQQALKLLGTLRSLSEAQLAVAQVNADLPAGAEPIGEVELMARGREAQPRRDLRSSDVALWCFGGTWTPVSAEAQDRAVQKGESRAYLGPAPPKLVGSSAGASVVDLDLRRFRRVEYLPATDWDVPASLFGLNLPGLWSAPGASPFGVDHASVIQTIDAALRDKPNVVAERRPVVELLPIPPDVAPAAPAKLLIDTGRSRLAAQPRQAARGARR